MNYYFLLLATFDVFEFGEKTEVLGRLNTRETAAAHDLRQASAPTGGMSASSSTQRARQLGTVLRRGQRARPAPYRVSRAALRSYTWPATSSVLAAPDSTRHHLTEYRGTHTHIHIYSSISFTFFLTGTAASAVAASALDTPDARTEKPSALSENCIGRSRRFGSHL